jgi:transposase
VNVLRHPCQKYACPCCKSYIVSTKKPKQPIEKSIASAGLLAHIATDKYADALPLYRQVSILERSGITLDCTSLANWMIHCGDLVQSIINRMLDTLQQQPVLHMDETPVQVPDKPGRKAQNKSYMRVISSLQQSGQHAVPLHYSPTRNGNTPKLKLNDFRGALMVDGYEGYQAACNEGQLIRLGC